MNPTMMSYQGVSCAHLRLTEYAAPTFLQMYLAPMRRRSNTSARKMITLVCFVNPTSIQYTYIFTSPSTLAMREAEQK
jgi:hypothetical protein